MDLYEAEYRSVKSKSEGKRLDLGFKVPGYDDLFFKEVLSSLDSGPLRADLEAIRGGEFTDAEIKAGVDPETLIGQPCRAVLVHRRSNGGRKVAEVAVVLPLKKEEASEIS